MLQLRSHDYLLAKTVEDLETSISCECILLWKRVQKNNKLTFLEKVIVWI